MNFDVVSADHWSADALAACFSAAFDGYLAGSFTMDGAALGPFLARQGADLQLSRCIVRDGALVGLAFVGQNGRRRRISGMGVRSEARRSGASRRLLQQVIDDARNQGLEALELEVFVQNAPAVRLYRGAGFADGPPLWGFELVPHAAVVSSEARPWQVSLTEGAEWLLAQGRDDLPYQVSLHAWRHMDPAIEAWRWGDALMLFTEPHPKLLVLPLLFDADAAQRDALALVRWLLAAHPEQVVRVPPLMRDDVAARALRAAGFVTLPLHQMQMRLPLR